ncbi:hypothetical protein [Phocaeicola coprocola]|uniref:hypothetical protein n=1 Tax=Phocaeicola coprocola TaxID=310298 RepID=UPI003994AA66
MKFDLKLLEKYVDETTMCCEKHPLWGTKFRILSDHINKTTGMGLVINIAEVDF